MPIDFYYVPYPPACRAVLMVAKALNIELNLKLTSTLAGEHMTPEFIKLNPQHCVPTMVDDGFPLWESRAILTYLVNKYGKGSSLYPSDPRERAVVDQRLYFDISTLNQRFFDYLYPQISAGDQPDADKLKKIDEALEFLNTFLEGSQWVAGSNLTLADISIFATVSSFGAVDVDIFKYPNIKAWFEKAKNALPGYSINEEGIKIYNKIVQDLLNKKKSI